MGFKCVLCKRPPDKVNKISLHSFPNRQTYPVIYDQWLAACNLDEKDDVSGQRVCSCHFREQDKLMDYTLTRIKPEAIPSINVKHKKTTLHQQPEIKNDEDPTPHPHEEKSSDLVSTVEKLSQISEQVIVENLNDMDGLDDHFELLYRRMMEKKTCTVMTFPLKAGLDPIECVSVATHGVSETSTTNNSDTLARTLDETEEAEEVSSKFQPPQKNRRYFHPRYISEIRTPDVATPRRASRIIEFVKEQDRKKNVKIKNLQATKRRLQKRVTSLESLLTDIRTRNNF